MIQSVFFKKRKVCSYPDLMSLHFGNLQPLMSILLMTSVVNCVPLPFCSCHCWDDEVVMFSRVVVDVLEYVT